VCYCPCAGYYVFIETSAPRRRGDKAWLKSESLAGAANTPKCVSFWYHMYGINMGSLNVYVATNGSLPGDLRWSLSGNQGNQWNQGRFTVNSAQDFDVSYCSWHRCIHYGLLKALNKARWDGRILWMRAFFSATSHPCPCPH
jgi:hypothetical protein